MSKFILTMAACALTTVGACFAADDGSAKAKFVMRPICKQGYHSVALGVPGNSLEAFKLAWKKGAKLIETDCWMIKSGRIILVHDQRVLEIHSRQPQPPIKTFTDADVARIDIGRAVKSAKPVRMAYLEDVFATMPKDVVQCPWNCVKSKSHPEWMTSIDKIGEMGLDVAEERGRAVRVVVGDIG